MSQTVLLEKLAKFLELTSPKDTSELQTVLKDGGRCFAFALCYAAMKQQNKLDWWEALLNKIATWDESISSLDEELTLPQAIPLPLSPKCASQETKQETKAKSTPSHNPITLKSHMERVVNYIFYQQARKYTETKTLKEFSVDGFSQFSINSPVRHESEKGILKTKPSHFEMTDETKTVTHSKDRKYVARYCSDEYLIEFFQKNKEQIKNSMCMVHSINHATTLFFDGKKWQYYDPNYDHKSLGSIHKEFAEDAIPDLVKEIKKMLGNTLILELVSVDKPIKLDLPEEKSSHDAIKETGLAVMALHTPESIHDFLEEQEKTSEGQIALAKGLVNKTQSENAGLTYIIDYAPADLAKVINIVFKNPEATDYFLDSLFLQKTKTGDFFYEFLMKNRSGEFKQIQSNLLKLFPVGKPKYQDYDYKRNLREFIKKLIFSGVNINDPNLTGYGTFLHFAAAIDDIELVAYLINNGADLYSKNGDGKIPLEVSSVSLTYNYSKNTLKQKMLDKVIDTLDVKTITEEVKRYSLNLKDANVTRVFYKNDSLRIPDAQKVSTDEERRTLSAISEVTSFLIKEGANIYSIDKDNKTILTIAQKTNHVALFKDKEITKQCNLGYIFSKKDVVTEKNFKDMVAILLDAGIDVDKPDSDGDTALHWAAFRNDAELFCLLVNKKANLKLKNKCGRTPFEEGHYTHGLSLNPKIAIIGLSDKIQVLSTTVEKITLNFKEEKGLTYASVEAMFDEFCFDKETIALKDIDDNTVLHLAVLTNQPDIVKNILAHCKNLKPLNKAGLIPIQAGLTKFGSKLNPEIVAILDASMLDQFNLTAAIEQFDEEKLAESLKKEIKLDKVILYNLYESYQVLVKKQPLQTDQWYKKLTNILAMLIKAGLDINIADPHGNTPLHLLAAQGQSKLVQILLEHKANPLLKNSAGKTPLEHAKSQELKLDPQVKKYLLNKVCVVPTTAPKKFKLFVKENALLTCQALLRNYIKPNHFFFSHSHIPAATEIMKRFDEFISIQEVYNAIRVVTAKHIDKSGSLYRLIQFCAELNGEKLVDPPVQTFIVRSPATDVHI